MKVLITIFITFLFMSASSAQNDFFKNTGIELGVGNNHLYWRSDMGNADRTEFLLTPTFRINYEYFFSQKVSIFAFIDYNKFGGKSKKYSDGYEDEYFINAIEFGLLLKYNLDVINIGCGIKYKKHVSYLHRYNNSIGQSDPQGDWDEETDNIFFSPYSTNFGFRLDHIFLEHFTVGIESWFGFSDIEKDDLNDYIDIKENHFRLFIGYRL